MKDFLQKHLGPTSRPEKKENGISRCLGFGMRPRQKFTWGGLRGEVNITVEKLYTIATTLGCEPASLLPGGLGSQAFGHYILSGIIVCHPVVTHMRNVIRRR